MGIIYARIDDGLERKFRIEVTRLYGGQRGALSKVVAEAIELWLREKCDIHE